MGCLCVFFTNKNREVARVEEALASRERERERESHNNIGIALKSSSTDCE